MRIRIRPVLMAVAVATTTMAFSAGPAAAGGPTSVIIANPMTGETGALYATDSNYQALHDALEPARGISVERPPQLAAGPGTPAINITWLIHDVSVWRVDRVRLDLKYVWVQTSLLADGTLPFDGTGEWHVAADPQVVLEVLDALGVLSDQAQTDAGQKGFLDETVQSGVSEPAAASDDEPVTAIPAPSWPAWQWTAAAVAFGVALGAVGRPAMAAVLRRRTPGPRQQLINLEPPGDDNSGQPNPDPTKAAPLVLDLGDLYPADLPR